MSDSKSSCPSITTCFHEDCHREKVCMNAEQWHGRKEPWPENIERHRDPSVPKLKTLSQPTLPPYRNKFGKTKAEMIDEAHRRHHPGLMRTCKPENRKCHLQKVCGTLGSCVLTQERTLARPDLIPALKEAESDKAAMKILEEIMPGLKKYNDPRNFRSQATWFETL